MSALHHSVPNLELRSSPQGLVTGYASVFNGVDSYGDSIAPGAFTQTIARGKPLMLWAHKADKPIGRWDHLAEDSRGLCVEGQLNLKTSAGQEAFEHLRQRDLDGLSIGFRVLPGGAEQKGDVRMLKALDLVEVSVVSLPADPGARVLSVKSEQPTNLRAFEHALQSMGFSRRHAIAIAARGFGGIEESDNEQMAIAAALAVLRQTF